MSNAFKAELAHLEELETTLQRRRRVLEIQRARFGDFTPASIILELEDIEQQLAQVQQTLHQMRSTPPDTRCPYLGLLTFQEDDSVFFFGRDSLIGNLLGKVEQTSCQLQARRVAAHRWGPGAPSHERCLLCCL